MQDAVQIPAATAGRTVWLRVGAMIDGSGATPLRDAHVVYSKAGILYAGADTPPPELVKIGLNGIEARRRTARLHLAPRTR